MANYHYYESSDAHLPPGFRFHPTDEELITYYLLKKVLDSNFTGKAIAEVDLNKCEPWELPEKAKMGEKEWYFFSLRDRKYPTGLRTNRATEAGYWKATGKDREIYSSKTCSLVGMKKTLVFYRGRAPKGEKSNWVMHEYRLEGKFAYHYLSRSSKDEWVISRVFQKCGAGTGPGSGGGKKRLAPGINLYPEASSPSSVSLPPLLDSSTYTATSATSASTTDHESCSYDCNSAKEHVPCFSNSAAASFNHNSVFELPPPPLPPPAPAATLLSSLFDPSPSSGARFPRTNAGLSAFPNLRSLQENLHCPFFFPTAAAAAPPPQPINGSDANGIHYGSVTNWSAPDNQKVGPAELDCLWSF
ncbi:unnamed protein product [Coffea canephora]|uniref:NAC domain-containing protein n=2 Tax=Coffea TaxID=13442 RepID=A0A068UCE4_COFCA|nr:unnamed protein product [Coffea canephora]